MKIQATLEIDEDELKAAILSAIRELPSDVQVHVLLRTITTAVIGALRSEEEQNDQ